jgi:DivIVA domain-containing protein
VDRDAIQRRDFPVGRRGYDPASVDAHLRAVADELDSLRDRTAEPQPEARPSSLSASTSEQVRKILEAAERSAADLRDEAGQEAGQHVARVEEATDQMMGRLDALQHELDSLLTSLKRSGEMLEAGLAKLREDVGHVDGPEAGAHIDSPKERDLELPPAAPPPEPEAVPEPPVVAPDSPAAPEPPTHGAAADGANGAADEAGARLIALNMALGGTPREETARYLAEHYDLPDAAALLDDVYKRAGG